MVVMNDYPEASRELMIARKKEHTFVFNYASFLDHHAIYVVVYKCVLCGLLSPGTAIYTA